MSTHYVTRDRMTLDQFLEILRETYDSAVDVSPEGTVTQRDEHYEDDEPRWRFLQEETDERRKKNPDCKDIAIGDGDSIVWAEQFGNRVGITRYGLNEIGDLDQDIEMVSEHDEFYDLVCEAASCPADAAAIPTPPSDEGEAA